jgi:hypothetical protein
MEDIQRVIVNSHIAELPREGDAIRAERFAHDHSEAVRREPAVGAVGPAHIARARIGGWLMTLGTAVAGSAAVPSEPRADARRSG